VNSRMTLNSEALSSAYIQRHTVAAVCCIVLAASGCGKAFTTDNDAGNVVNAGSGGSTSDASSPLDGSVVPVISRDGLLLWLRSDQGVTIENGFVSQWLDQSGRHFDATQSQVASRPTLVVGGIGGHRALRFDGVDDFFQLPAGMADFSLGLTMFVVVNEQQTTSYTSLLEFCNGSEIDDIAFGQVSDNLGYEVLDQAIQGDSIQYDIPQVFTVLHRPDTTMTFRRNGTPAGAYTVSLPVVTTRQQNFVGQSLYSGSVTYLGLLGEVLVYGRAMTDAELVKTENDLKRRWTCCN
jgi:hypothetical protein